jgi:hypothetical protein
LFVPSAPIFTTITGDRSDARTPSHTRAISHSGPITGIIQAAPVRPRRTPIATSRRTPGTTTWSAILPACAAIRGSFSTPTSRRPRSTTLLKVGLLGLMHLAPAGA